VETPAADAATHLRKFAGRSATGTPGSPNFRSERARYGIADRAIYGVKVAPLICAAGSGAMSGADEKAVALIMFVVLVVAILAFGLSRRGARRRKTRGSVRPPEPPLTGTTIAEQVAGLRSGLTFEQDVALGEADQ
jgi:hypothetical protein